MRGFDFALPWLLLLIPLPLLMTRWRRQVLQGALGLHLANAMRARIGGTVTEQRTGRAALVARWVGWVLMICAIAGPRVVAATPALPATGRDIELVLDLSGSMVARDMLNQGQPITRIDLLKKAGTELIRRRAGDRVGLTIFAERALAAAPLSFDTEGVARALNHVEIGLVGRSTAIGDGLGLAVKRLSESKAPTRIIILLSDGSNNAGTIDPTGVTHLARELGMRIYTIGFGPNETLTPNDDPDSVDFVALQKIAKDGNGEAFRVRNGEDFADASKKIEKLIAGETSAPPAVLHRPLWSFPATFGFIVIAFLAASERRLR